MSFCLNHDSLNFSSFQVLLDLDKSACKCLSAYHVFILMQCWDVQFVFLLCIFFFSLLTLPAMVLLYWRTFWLNSWLLVSLWFLSLQVAYLKWISTASEESLQGISVAVIWSVLSLDGWAQRLNQRGDRDVVAGADTCLWSYRMLPAVQHWEDLPWAHWALTANLPVPWT